MRSILFFVGTMLLLGFYQSHFSQNYFDPNNITEVQLYGTNQQGGITYFGLEKISNSDLLDVAVTHLENNTGIGQWNSNNGDGTFSVSNYPNPFNPVTVIHFTIPQSSKVKITIYISIGQRISELANGFYEAGAHAVQFDGSNLPSGVYFYRIETGQLIETRKVVLLK